MVEKKLNEMQEVTKATKRRHVLNKHWPFFVVLLAFLVLSIFYNLYIPIGEADHEVSHYRYIEYVKNHWKRPPRGLRWPPVILKDKCQIPESKYPGMVEWEFTQPPLYYFSSAAFFFWLHNRENWWPPANPYNILRGLRPSGGINEFVHTSDELTSGHSTVWSVHIHRLFSTFLGMLGVWAVYLTGLQVFRQDEKLSALMAAGVGFVPMYIFSSSVISNDILVGILGLWEVYFALKSASEEVDLKHLIFAAMCVFLAIFTKYTAVEPVIVLAALTVVLFVKALRKRNSLLIRFSLAALASWGLVALGGYWWFFVLAGGPISVGARYGAVREPLYTRLIKPLHGAVVDVFHRTWFSLKFSYYAYWGLFGADALFLKRWQILLLTALSVLAILGLAKALVKKSVCRRVRWLILLGTVLIAINWYVLYDVTFYWIRGRYVLALYSIMAFLFIVGMQAYGRLGNYIYISLIFIIALSVPLLIIKPAYSPPDLSKKNRSLPRFVIDHPINARFGNLAELVGMQVEPKNVNPYSMVTVTLTWHVLNTTQNNYVVGVSLEDGNHNYIAGVSNFPVNGRYPTSFWKKEDIIQDKYWFPVLSLKKVDLPSAGYIALSVLCPSPKGDHYLPVRDQFGKTLGTMLYSAPVRLGLPTSSDVLIHAHPLARFGDELALISVKGISGGSFPHRTAHVEMTWMALRRPKHDYSIYFHLIDNRGHLVWGQDALLTQGYYPSSLWRSGETVRHVQDLDFPPASTLRPGTYRLVIGIYFLPTGERLPLAVLSGKSVKTPDGYLLAKLAIH